MKAMAIALLSFLAFACTTTAPPSAGDRWAIRMLGTDRHVPVKISGGLVVELTGERATKTCTGVPDLFTARIVETHGLRAYSVNDSVAMTVKNGAVFVALDPGSCEGGLVLSGATNGTRARGDVVVGSLAEPIAWGRFAAEKL